MLKRKRLILLIGCASFVLLCNASSSAAQSWSNGYAYRRAVKVDHTKVPNTDQSNFPVLFSGTYTYLASTSHGGGATNASGYDIIFTADAAGTQILPFEQQTYNGLTGAVSYWVQVPLLSHTADTVFYLFYGNSSVTTDQSNRTAVWDTNYKDVLHFNQAPNGPGSEKDSTANGNNGTPANSGIALASDGIAGNSLRFDGVSSSNSVTVSPGLPGGSPLTISVWIKTMGLNPSAQSVILDKSQWSSSGWELDDNGQYGPVVFFRTLPNYNSSVNANRMSINDNKWHYLVGTASASGNLSLYLDGSLVGSASAGAVAADTVDPLSIGGFGGNQGGGLLTEVRVSSTLRSADWIAAEYNNQGTPWAFYDEGSPAIIGLSESAGHFGDSVTITGRHFGATEGNSTVKFGGVLAAVTSWADTSIVVTVPLGANSGSVVVTVDGLVSNGMTFNALPPAWSDSDVGQVSIAGTAGFANSSFTQQGSGAGVSGTADALNFLAQPLTGDGSIVARVVSVQGTAPVAGVMIRESLAPSAASAYVFYNGYMEFYTRSTTGGSENSQGSSAIRGLPYWIKLVRLGNVFSDYISPDGITWTQFEPSQTIPMAQNVYVGLAVGSPYGSSLATAVFDSVSVSTAVSPAPLIAALSATTGGAGSLVGIQGSGFGASQNSGFVTLNGITVPVKTWSDSEIVITVPSGATSGPIIVSAGPGLNSSNPEQFEVTGQPLPAGWLNQDIGETGGSSTYSGNNFTLNASSGGSGSIYGTSDAFEFVYQTLSGDGTIVARVSQLQGGNWPQAGIMVRETLTPSSTHAFVYFQPNQASLYYRSSSAGSTSYQSASFVHAATPYWVKLNRSGNVFTGWVSPDGVYWTQVGPSQTITMAQTVYIGLALSSAGANASFDNVSLATTSASAPVITGLSSSTVAIGSQLVINGSGFGASQDASIVTLNDTPIPVLSWSATSITITIPAGATSGSLSVAVGQGLNCSNPVYLAVTSQPLPASWKDQDISSVGTGSATYANSNGTFTVRGAGGGIQGTSDSFHFSDQQLAGDGTFIARVVSFQSSGYPQIGIMIRETLDPASANVFIYFQPNQAYLCFRSSAGASMSSQATTFIAAPYPYWLKLTRNGNAFSGFISLDGATWTQVGATQTIPMAQNVYVGLAVTLPSTTATFDNVSLDTPAAPAPVITSLSATTGPVGTQVTINGSHFGSSQSNSVVWLNHAAMTANSWSDSSINITIASGAISGYLVVSVGPSMNCSNPVVFTITSQPLPSGWLDADIGSVGASGSATYSNGSFTVQAQGSNIDGGSNSSSLNADGFHFVYQSLSGDGVIVARVSDVQGMTFGTEAGVMMRQTLDAGSVNGFVWYYDEWSNFGFRASGGANAAIQNTSTPFATSSVPYWVKLARIGGNVTAYTSPDGQNWSQVGAQQSASWPQTVYVGLAFCNCATQTAATFDNVSVTSGTMPLISGISPAFGTIGTSVTITGSGFGNVQGSSSVRFNGAVASSITSWSNTQIVATVPVNASSGPVSVVVNSIESNTDSIFTFYHPVITSLSPSSGQAGATVVVSGTGFGATQLSGSSVLFNGVPAQVKVNFGYAPIPVWSDTSITVYVPQTTSGPVTVSLQGIVSNAVQFNVEPLAITAISPSSGPAGSAVTITGTGFGSSQTSSTVDFNGTSAAVQSWSDSQIVAIVPPGAVSGSVDVTVGGFSTYGPSFTMTQTIQLTDSKGNQSSYTSAMIGGLWVPIQGQGSGCSTCTQRGNISYTYDSAGHPLSRTDENGNTTTYTYDANGDVLTVTVPVNATSSATTTYTYNSFGEVLTATDPLGNVTTNTYDSNGNLLSVTAPAPNGSTAASVIQFAYDSKGELTTITDPLGNQTAIAYFPTGLIQAITDAQGHVTTYAYDSRGNRTSVTDANSQQTTFAYDAMNRLTKITYPDSTTTQFGYDYRGRRTSVTDQNGKVTQYAYDDADRLLTVTDAANHVTTYGYDTESNLTSIQDANHNTTSFAYDAFGRVTTTTFPSGLIEQYSYDNVGNLTSKTDRRNQLIQYTYDWSNRLTKKSYPDTSAVNYTYDLDSRLTQVSDPTGTYSFTFDNMGRLIGTTTSYTFLPGRNFTTSYTYDKASNRTGFTDPEGGSTTYVYDTLNRLQPLTPPTAFGSGSFGFSYDALSRRTQMTRLNNVTTNYAYDNLSRLTSVLHQLAGSTIDGATYTLDNAANRTAKTDQRTAVATSYG